MMPALSFDPWLADPPPFDAYLPGGLCDIAVTPSVGAICARDLPALHGMLSGLLADVGGIRHHERLPRFSLFPSSAPIGWSVYFDCREAIAALAQQVHAAKWRDRLVAVRFGLVRRVRSPCVPWRGRRILHIETLTPVLVRRTVKPNEDNGWQRPRSVLHDRPTTENIRSAITIAFVQRLGLPPAIASSVMVELIAHDTTPRKTQLGGKYAAPKGWSGSVVLAANAPAAALLKVTETTGLGGRTAFGFGRVVVREA